MIFLNRRTCNFFRDLANKKGSISQLGKEHYESPRSIYQMLEKFEGYGLITTTKEDKNLKVVFTKKGQQVLESIFVLIPYS